MSDAIVAKRYADALFQLAKDKNNLETIREELKAVRDVFIENPKMKEVLYHPRIKYNDKEDKNKCDTMKEELKVVRDDHIENPKMKEILYHPRNKYNDKVALINSAFGSCNEDMIHTIKLLNEGRRIEYVTDMVAYFTDNY